MKILHTIAGIEKISGGPSQAIIGINNALSDAGIESYIATTNSPVDRYELVDYERVKEHIIFCDRWRIDKHAVSLELYRWLKQHITDFDIVHIHSLLNFPSFIAAYWARKKNIPYIIRPAGVFNSWISNKSLKRKILTNVVEKQNLKQVSAIQATSEAEVKCLTPFFDRNIIHNIPLGINLPEKRKQRHNDISSSKIKILFLSRLHPKKNIPTLLTAIKMLVDKGISVSLRIAGEAASDQIQYKTLLHQQTKQLNLTHVVEFIGFVDGEDKEREFLNADLFVLPSFDENFGIAVLEAMSYGLPLIISDGVALSAEVEQYNSGFVVNCSNASEIAESVIQLKNNSRLWQELSDNSYLLASKFTWQSTANSLVHLYDNILRRK